MKKISVGLIGCTGLVGQTYLMLLQNHPYFEVEFLGGSERSEGLSYSEATKKSWFYQAPQPKRDLKIEHYANLEKAKNCQVVFSALPSEISQAIDLKYANQGSFVVTHGSFHRANPIIPLIIPEINPHDLELINKQRSSFGSNFGGIVAKPNCSIQSYLLPLFPLLKSWSLSNIEVTTLQSLSGAGYHALDLLKNPEVIPHIPDEENKSENEPIKILYQHLIQNNETFHLSAKCIRVPTVKGHFAITSFSSNEIPDEKALVDIWNTFKPSKEIQELPSSPSSLIQFSSALDSPRTTHCLSPFDMGIHVGQLKKDNTRFRFVALSDNMTRGAAGGGIQLAELALHKGFIHGTNQSRFASSSKSLSVSRNRSESSKL